jgi:type IV secretory pathway TraG/TraD family ATPase VirD4
MAIEMATMLKVTAILSDRRALIAVSALMLMAAALLARKGRSAAQGFKRGARIVTNHRHSRRRRVKPDGAIRLAGVPVPAGDESKHFKLIGTTGTGKSTAIRELLSCAILRQDRAVVADPDGAYAAQFLNRYRGDVLLNPFDARSVSWDLFAELHDDFDAEQLASSLIPLSDDPATREWRAYARTLLAALLRRSREGSRRHVAELWRLITTASAEELRPLLAGSPAQPFLDPENARMFTSIRSVAVSSLAALDFVRRHRGSPFSVRSWVRDNSRRLLFIPYSANQIAALRSMVSAWLRLAIFEAMSGAEGRDQRLWIVIDELDALGAIDGLKDALVRLRKYGGRCVLGFQSLSQVSSTYGHDAQTIVENCGNTLILRCSSSENGGTAQFASRLIGEREVTRVQVSRGSDRDSLFSGKSARRSRNVSQQVVTEPGVMAAEIEQLPDLCGYLKTASSPAWLKVKFH